ETSARARTSFQWTEIFCQPGPRILTLTASGALAKRIDQPGGRHCSDHVQLDYVLGGLEHVDGFPVYELLEYQLAFRVYVQIKAAERGQIVHMCVGTASSIDDVGRKVNPVVGSLD